MRLVIVLLALTAGCTSQSYWVRTWDGALTTELQVIDRMPWGAEVLGVTICDKARRHCNIIISKDADRECTEAHERKHAAGLDHPEYRIHAACFNRIGM